MLTTLALVKARLKLADSDVVDDELLEGMIALVSARFESECNRSFGYQAQSDEFQGDETELRVSRYPIVSVEAISTKRDETEGWVEAVGLTYIVRKECVVSLRGRLARSDDALKVDYFGGYNLPDTTPPVEGVADLPADIRTQATEQVVYLYQNKDRLGITSVSGQQGSISLQGKLDLLPSVAAVLRRHERWMP